jgi:hypothetical protein
MTAEELSDARLGQIKELERDNTDLRVRLLNMAREKGAAIGALKGVMIVADSMTGRGEIDEPNELVYAVRVARDFLAKNG